MRILTKIVVAAALLIGCHSGSTMPQIATPEKSPEAITSPAGNHLIAASTWNAAMEDELDRAIAEKIAPKPFVLSLQTKVNTQREEIKQAQVENTSATTAIQKINRDWGESETKWKKAYADLTTTKDGIIAKLNASLLDQTRKHYVALSEICFTLFLVAGGLGLWTGRSALLGVSALCAVGMIVALVVAQTLWLVPYIGAVMAVVLLGWGVWELVEHTKAKTLATVTQTRPDSIA